MNEHLMQISSTFLNGEGSISVDFLFKFSTPDTKIDDVNTGFYLANIIASCLPEKNTLEFILKSFIVSSIINIFIVFIKTTLLFFSLTYNSC